MNNQIINLINQKKILQDKLNNMIYGSVEIRSNDSKDYIYVHSRVDGRLITKYVGEYSKELHDLILSNSIAAKKIKKEIKSITKELQSFNYSEVSLDESVKLNIDFAKRRLVDTIYKQAVLEGVATTYADTENIIEGGKVQNMTPDDVMKIINLKHAWEFILNEDVILVDNDLPLLCEINKLVEEGFYYNAGKLRSTPVNIGGTVWKPNLPIESKIKEELETMSNKRISNVDKAIELLLYVMKKQIFIDGNKRTAVLFSNHLLISKGLGIIVIPEDKIEEYKNLLIKYYETDNSSDITRFLKNICYTKLK